MILYRRDREIFDLQQKKIGFDNDIMKIQVLVSFWRCFFSSGASNFKYYWNIRADMAKKLNTYQKLNVDLGEENHQSLIDMDMYQRLKTEEFKEFEKNSRRVLKQLPVFHNNKDQVIKFAGVLKIIKSGLTK